MTFGLKPLLNYSITDERATLLPSETDSMPRKSTRKAPKRKTKKNPRGYRGVKFVKGRISLRVAGYSGVQRIAPSQLVKFVPLNKLKVAAKRLLKNAGVKKHRKIRRKRSPKKR